MGRLPDFLLMVSAYLAQIDSNQWAIPARGGRVCGSGDTMWGAKALNGLANIITRNPKETPGDSVQGRGGDYDRAGGSSRLGFDIGRIGTLPRNLEAVNGGVSISSRVGRNVHDQTGWGF